MSAPLATWIDGQPAPQARWTLDRALHYGDGLFETITVRGGGLRFEALHRARLEEGCRRLRIPIDSDAPWQQARRIAQLHPECTLKLLVSRGDAVARGYTIVGSERPRVIALVHAAPDEAEYPQHVRVVTLRSLLGENPQLAGLKHCNRLEQVLARQELQSVDCGGQLAWEGLLGSSSGLLVSGTMSNVFLELDGEWMTPALESCGVAGVMRGVVLREAGALGLPIAARETSMAALGRCTSMFLTNARMGVRAVHELDGRALRQVADVARLAARVSDLAR
jgi:4-amino-4-deoxychorismate lyase